VEEEVVKGYPSRYNPEIITGGQSLVQLSGTDCTLNHSTNTAVTDSEINTDCFDREITRKEP